MTSQVRASSIKKFFFRQRNYFNLFFANDFFFHAFRLFIFGFFFNVSFLGGNSDKSSCKIRTIRPKSKGEKGSHKVIRGFEEIRKGKENKAQPHESIKTEEHKNALY